MKPIVDPVGPNM